MQYLFYIVLCFTFLATINFWHRTRGEREAYRRRKAEERKEQEIEEAKKAAKSAIDSETKKNCSTGWHTFGKWTNSSRYKNVQERYCTKCNIRDERVV